MANLGFVGLGVMGGRIAKRLLDAGHAVIGTNRTRSKAEWLIDAGMRWADTPREVAEGELPRLQRELDVDCLRLTDGQARVLVAAAHEGRRSGARLRIHVDDRDAGGHRLIHRG